MKVAFLSNYLNHHQIPLSEEIYKTENVEYKFIQTEPIEEERKKMGWDFDETQYPYLVKYYEDPQRSQRIIDEYDVIIFGSAPWFLLDKRRREKKLTFIYSERIYKKGQWRVFSPRGFLNMKKTHGHSKMDNMYLLCASAYLPCDMHLLGLYKDRMFKWGYFPRLSYYSKDELLSLKNKDRVEMLWCSRFIKWKHPEYIINLAKDLKKQGYTSKDCYITMIGVGPLRERFRSIIRRKGLNDIISIEGPFSPDEVRTRMEKSNMFLLTSDYNEGWGAVVNEAMNSACCVIASHCAGSVPYLIKHNKNGFIFNGKSYRAFRKTVINTLIAGREQMLEVGSKAYDTINLSWNAKNASANLLMASEMISQKKQFSYVNEGPCSKANMVRERNMLNKLLKKDLF